VPCGVTIFVTPRKCSCIENLENYTFRNFFIFLGKSGAVGRGGVGGVGSVTVGVQFQPAPSRQAKGGGKPESVSRKQAETNTNLYTYFILCPLCKVIFLLSTGL
jgi:hypothetical protein